MPLEAIIGVSYNQSISEILNFPVHSPVSSSFQFNSGIVPTAKLEINLIPSFEVLISAGVNLGFFINIPTLETIFLLVNRSTLISPGFVDPEFDVPFQIAFDFEMTSWMMSKPQNGSNLAPIAGSQGLCARDLPLGHTQEVTTSVGLNLSTFQTQLFGVLNSVLSFENISIQPQQSTLPICSGCTSNRSYYCRLGKQRL